MVTGQEEEHSPAPPRSGLGALTRMLFGAKDKQQLQLDMLSVPASPDAQHSPRIMACNLFNLRSLCSTSRISTRTRS